MTDDELLNEANEAMSGSTFDFLTALPDADGDAATRQRDDALKVAIGHSVLIYPIETALETWDSQTDPEAKYSLHYDGDGVFVLVERVYMGDEEVRQNTVIFSREDMVATIAKLTAHSKEGEEA